MRSIHHGRTGQDDGGLAEAGEHAEREPDLRLVGHFKNAEDAARDPAALPCDLVLAAVHLPCMSGLDLVRRLLEARPDVRALVVSARPPRPSPGPEAAAGRTIGAERARTSP